jgi:AraC-like DNA-binding protein
MDHFEALFRHFTPTAQAFFSGNLCTVVAFDDPDGMGHLHILRSGRLTVTRTGRSPLELAEPAILLMPRHLAHGFVPDPEIGADLICATIQIGGRQGNPIALGMPDLLVIPFDRVPTISPTLELMVGEAFAALGGRQVALDRLFEYLIVQTIRHVIDQGLVSGGVLAALGDPRLAQAITAMHDKPGRLWTLDDLAGVAGMSRTAFARRFRDIAGSSPMDYLTRWRMTIAQNMLRKGASIKAIASAAGYHSPAALSRTFAKISGVSPRQWQTSTREVNQREKLVTF